VLAAKDHKDRLVVGTGNAEGLLIIAQPGELRTPGLVVRGQKGTTEQKEKKRSPGG
jgi:hypothetical protein